MKRVICIILVFNIIRFAWGKEIVDMAGRKVTVPNTIKKILPYDSRTSILLYPCACDKMVAKSKLPGQRKYIFIGADYLKLSEVDIKNLEEVLKVGPEVIIAGIYASEKNLDGFNKLQKRLGIPVVLVDMSIDKLDKTYTFLGKLLTKEQECKKLADFLNSTYSQLNQFVKTKSLSGISAYYTNT